MIKLEMVTNQSRDDGDRMTFKCLFRLQICVIKKKNVRVV